MKKYQFYCIAIATVGVTILFAMCFIITLASVSGLIVTSMNIKALAIFSVAFGVIARIIAPLCRDCYDDAFQNMEE